MELREILQTSIRHRTAIQRQLGETTVVPGGYRAGYAHPLRIQQERELLMRINVRLGFYELTA